MTRDEELDHHLALQSRLARQNLLHTILKTPMERDRNHDGKNVRGFSLFSSQKKIFLLSPRSPIKV